MPWAWLHPLWQHHLLKEWWLSSRITFYPARNLIIFFILLPFQNPKVDYPGLTTGLSHHLFQGQLFLKRLTTIKFFHNFQDLKLNYLRQRVGVSQHQIRGQLLIKLGQFRFPSITIILIAKILIPSQLPKDHPSYHCLILEKVRLSQNPSMLKIVAIYNVFSILRGLPLSLGRKYWIMSSGYLADLAYKSEPHDIGSKHRLCQRKV